MADNQENTTFMQRATGRLTKHKALASGTGLSAAALIYLHGVFATRSDVAKLQQAQATQWQQISQLNAQVEQLKGRNDAYELLLRFLSAGNITFETNQPWTPH